MTGKMWLYVVLIVLGFLDAALNLWVYLLDRETRPLLLAGTGLLIMIAGIVNLRRERQAKRI